MKIIILLGVLFAFNSAQAATYYISPTGNNNNAGTLAAPWQTIAKANGNSFVAGDIVLFEGGQTFTGTLTPARNGTSTNRITFGSYGTGRATISSAAAGGLVINGRSFVTVQNLIFRGNWQNATNTAVNNASNTAIGVSLFSTPSNIILDNLKISGYGSFGIEAQSADSNITITRFEIHDNKDTGIEFRALSGASKHTNVTLSDGSTYRNRGWATPNSSGNGIRLADANGAMIERCIAYENGKECTTTGGGPVGIWSWLSNNVIIQYCIAYRNGTAGSWDGGGFDIDGGNTNCLLQYNYSFENEGAGYLVAAYSGSSVNNAVIRYNLSVNDATKGVTRNQGSIHVWNDASNTAANLQNVYIYNNTVIQTGNASAGSCFQTADAPMTNVRVFNNIFIAANGLSTTKVNQVTGVNLQGNLYYCLDDATNPRIRWGGTTYSSLAAFRSGTSQETLSGSPVGLHADPNLFNATAVPPVLTAWSQTIPQLNPWRLTSSSPARNNSLSAVSLIGATTGSGPAIGHPGTKDLFDTVLPATLLDIGMHELIASSVATAINLTPATATLPLNTSRQFIATGVDGSGIPVDPQPTMSWSVDGGGTVDGTGLFTAGSTIGGPYIVTATASALSNTATVMTRGGPIVEEAFSYMAGTGALASKNGGIGWPGSWDTATNDINATGFSYSSGGDTLVTSGGRATTKSGQSSFRNLPAAYSTGTYWLSFLARSGGPGGTDWGGLSLFNGGSELAFFGQSYGSLNWSIADGSSPATNSTADQAFIVAKITLNPSGTDSALLWVNPALNTTPLDANATNSRSGVEMGFDRLRIASSMTFDLDEIRLGTSFAQVAPRLNVATDLQTFREANGLAADGSQDTETPASDEVANLLKFAFNMLGNDAGQATNLATPNNSVLLPTTTAGLPSAALASGTENLTLTYIRRKPATTPASGITYVVEFSDDLNGWAINAAATEDVTSIDSIFERVTVSDSISNAPRRFVRLRITAP